MARSRSLRFKLHNSSYRSLRFAFDGAVGTAYRSFLLWPIASYLTIGLLAPLAHQRMKAYVHGNSRYGAERFSFDVREGKFYGIYLKLLGFLILFLIGVGAVIAIIAGMFSQFGQGMDNEVRISVDGEQSFRLNVNTDFG